MVLPMPNFPLSTFPKTLTKKSRNIQKLIKGYPVTSTPVKNEILKHAVDFKTLEGSEDFVKLTLAEEGTQPCSEESLQWIRNYLQMRFRKYPAVLKTLEHPLPSNTIAVSITEYQFIVGDFSHEFKFLDKKYKSAEDSFWTYQKFSDNMETTIFNENGVSYIAGCCFYLTPKDKKMRHPANERHLLQKSHKLAHAFPFADRMKSYNYCRWSVYTRFCKSVGQQIVAVDKKENGIVHELYDHFTNKYSYLPCQECNEEFKNYVFDKSAGDGRDVVIPPTPMKPTGLQKLGDTCSRLKHKLIAIIRPSPTTKFLLA